MSTVEPTSSLDPVLGPHDSIEFHDAHRPVLIDGDYEVTVSQSLGDLDYHPTATAHFSVSGPRFTIAPADVKSVFPPQSSRGRFERVVPHVILRRSTMPWERSPVATDIDRPPPWMALVLVDAAVEQVDTMTVGAVRAASSGDGQFPGLATETTDDSAAVLQVVTVSADHLPAARDLPWSAHVRVTGTGASAVESAVVVATSLPEPGHRYRVHLVSLEGWFEADAAGELAASSKLDPNHTVRLISLFSWDFTCQTHDRHGFSELVKQLDVGVLLRPPTPSDVEAGDEGYLRSGFVALPHRLRNGHDVSSWYHGPLVPGATTGVALDLPAQRADDLLVYDRSTGMLDTSYAAAWELGRLLVLQNERLAMQLHDWKRREKHHELKAAARAEVGHLGHLHPAAGAVPEFDVGGWFATNLVRLAAVPFRYLVADEAMLPSESFRFFNLDTTWVDALIDGGFSIGRTTADELARDRARRAELPEVPYLQGFLLRSQLVSAYPGLMIEAFGEVPTDIHNSGGRVPHVRIDHVGPGVLLALFDGWVESVAIHLHAQTLHFGLRDGVPIPAAGLSLADLAENHSADAGVFASGFTVPVPVGLISKVST